MTACICCSATRESVLNFMMTRLPRGSLGGQGSAAPGRSGYVGTMGRGFARRSREWWALAILTLGLGCGARTGLDVGSGDDGPGGSSSDGRVSLDAVAVSDTTVGAPFDGTAGDVTGDGPPGSDADDGGGGDSAADSGIDATLDSESDATLASQGDATPDSESDAPPDSESDAALDSASDAPPDDVASDAPSVADAAEAGDVNVPDGGCSPVGSYRCPGDGHPQHCPANGLWS